MPSNVARGLALGAGPGSPVLIGPDGKLPALNGENLTGIASAPGRYTYFEIIRSSKTWVAPGKIKGRATVLGAGGSGGAAKNTPSQDYRAAAATGGCAGGTAIKTFTANAGEAFDAIVGAGGNPMFANDGEANAGNPGGQSYFQRTGGIQLFASGGAGGTAVRSTTSAGVTASSNTTGGGVGSGGDLNLRGGYAGLALASVRSSSAASGGGSPATLANSGYNSGGAYAQFDSTCAATGGAGAGGESGAVFSQSGASMVTGGGGAGGPSNSSRGGPDLFGITAEPQQISTLATSPLSFGIFAAYGGGSGGSASGATPAAPGGGGHGQLVASNPYQGGNGGIFAGGGAQAVGTQNFSTTGGTGGIGAGGGGVAVWAGAANYSVFSGRGGAGLILVEWDLVP